MEIFIAEISVLGPAKNTFCSMNNISGAGTLPPVKQNGSRLSYTTAEVAEMHGVSTKTVYRWIGRGLLPTSKASRKLLIPARAVDKFMEVNL
jgi:excisionase family DNA binding protein